MPSLKSPETAWDLEDGAFTPEMSQPQTGNLPTVRLKTRRRETRTYTRVPSSLPVNVKFGGVYELLGEALDLSARGMLFELDRKLTPGTPVELIFRLPRQVVGPGAIWLRCRARIVRVQSGAHPDSFRLAARISSYEIFRIS